MAFESVLLQQKRKEKESGKGESELEKYILEFSLTKKLEFSHFFQTPCCSTTIELGKLTKNEIDIYGEISTHQVFEALWFGTKCNEMRQRNQWINVLMKLCGTFFAIQTILPHFEWHPFEYLLVILYLPSILTFIPAPFLSC